MNLDQLQQWIERVQTEATLWESQAKAKVEAGGFTSDDESLSPFGELRIALADIIQAAQEAEDQIFQLRDND